MADSSSRQPSQNRNPARSLHISSHGVDGGSRRMTSKIVLSALRHQASASSRTERMTTASG